MESMGFVQITSRLGGGFAPWIAKGLQKYNRRVPFIVMGLIAIVSSVLLCFLPETKSQSTAELIDDKSSAKDNELKLMDENIALEVA